eukprot:TRINITY_DN74004_c0_g1_i1.p1 TRINITY_DN74004_c0_g1~~TRINITY_DN74004_c0_g1_i1.p1  ORF type:complete len:577 (-),score=71.27 TRINITY_DN74004_c0_g1_i1:150-1880(-)
MTCDEGTAEEDEPVADEEEEGDHNWNYKYNRRLACFSHTVASLAFCQDGRWLVAGTGSGDLKVWDATSWAEAARLRTTRREEVRSIDISPSQKWIIAAFASVLYIFECHPPWRLEQAMAATVDMTSKEAAEWYCVAFNPAAEVGHQKGGTGKDNHLAAFSTNFLSVLDYSSGWGADVSRRQRSIWQLARPTSIAYTADGFWLICGFESGQIQLWNAFSLTLERTLCAHGGIVNCVTSSPRGASYESRFVSCSVDQSLRVWHSRGWVLEQICPDTKSDRGGVRRCTFSSTGNWLVSVATELCLWRVCVTLKGKMVLRLHQRVSPAGAAEGVSAAAFCSINDTLGVGSRDGVLGVFTKVPSTGDEPSGENSHSQHGTARPSTSSSVVPWSLDRALPKPMLKITPGGLSRPGLSAEQPKSAEWFQRTHLRSFSMTSLGSRSSVSGSGAVQRMSATTAGGKLAVSSPAGRRVNVATCSASTTTSAADVRRMRTLPEMGRRRSSTFELGDALSALTASGGSPQSNHGGASGRLSSSPACQSGIDSVDVSSPIRKSIAHACRGLVHRISLDPHVITDNTEQS